MAEDFRSASTRHWNDASLLFKAGQLDNANHLLGFAVECAIKMVIQTAGPLPKNPNGKRILGHLPDLWTQAKLYAVHHADLMLELQAVNPFLQWRIEDRYSISGHVSSSDLTPRMTAAKAILSKAGVMP